MVLEKKKQEVKELTEKMKKYPVIGLVDLYKMPSKQLQAIRKELRDKIEIKMVKKRLLHLAVKDAKKQGLERLLEFDPKEPTIILTNENSFKLYKLLEANQSATFAKEGDVAPQDIIIPEGSTKLPAGPAIGELQRAKIPAMVKEGKIHVSKDTIVAKKGSTITADAANILKKLDIQPMRIGVNLLATWEDSFIYGKDVLAVSTEDYINMILQAHTYAINLAVNTGFMTKESVEIMLKKGYLEGKALESFVGGKANVA